MAALTAGANPPKSAVSWHAGIVAHHYTRYLGDLSGGQMIAKRIRSQHGLESDSVAFYEFAELGDLNEFKQQLYVRRDILYAQLTSTVSGNGSLNSRRITKPCFF
ncbi:biliverdin-producing heme oxygenase [Canibacter zhuwentaonis]|uniref:biliverdin-producing heme oxygenase n=1 Tax=Canibacter zhuwentaonis TaxID=2837491 RepID=UPI002027ADA0|nr:biliverdin-producing heme oxygenase [Canibacter zhuwentaonis]